MSSVAAIIETPRSRDRRGQLVVALAAVVWSTAGVLQRQVSVSVATQVAGRALFAAVAVAAYVAVAERGRVAHACRAVGRAGIGFAACVAVSSSAFIIALNYASVAQVLFIQAIAPVLAALMGWGLLGERVNTRGGIAMAVALLGVGVMVGSPGGGTVFGIGMSTLMTISFAAAIVIARRHRDVSMVPATALSQLMVLVAAAPVAIAGGVGLDVSDVLWLALWGAGQIGLGLILLTIGARLIPATQVALITLLEVVLGPLWVWVAVRERPSAATLIGGAIVVAAVVLQATEPTRQAVVRPGESDVVPAGPPEGVVVAGSPSRSRRRQ